MNILNSWIQSGINIEYSSHIIISICFSLFVLWTHVFLVNLAGFSHLSSWISIVLHWSSKGSLLDYIMLRRMRIRHEFLRCLSLFVTREDNPPKVIWILDVLFSTKLGNQQTYFMVKTSPKGIYRSFPVVGPSPSIDPSQAEGNQGPISNYIILK